MCIGKNKFQSHVFCCEHSAGGLAKAIEAACKVSYHDNQCRKMAAMLNVITAFQCSVV